MAIPSELLLNAADPAVLVKYSAPLEKLVTGQPLNQDELALFDEASKIPYNLDAWDGYGVERETILQTAAGLGKRLVSLAGDTHNAWSGVLDVMSAARLSLARLLGLNLQRLVFHPQELNLPLVRDLNHYLPVIPMDCPMKISVKGASLTSPSIRIM